MTCGVVGSRPAECTFGHRCCAIHAVETPNRPCIACNAARATHRKQRCCEGNWTGAGPVHR